MNDKLNKLFRDWESRPHHQDNIQRGMGFVRDGVIDDEKWERAKPKILFLSKEAHNGGYKGSSWCLGTLIREEWAQAYYQLWLNVSRWTYGIQHTTKDNIPDFPDDEVEKTALLNSAFVNIKKSGGSSASDNDDLKTYVKEDGDLIKKQIELINPDVIVFCSTWDLTKELFEHEMVYEWVSKRDRQILIDYYHPTAHMHTKMMYFTLCAMYQKSIQKLDC